MNLKEKFLYGLVLSAVFLGTEVMASGDLDAPRNGRASRALLSSAAHSDLAKKPGGGSIPVVGDSGDSDSCIVVPRRQRPGCDDSRLSHKVKQDALTRRRVCADSDPAAPPLPHSTGEAPKKPCPPPTSPRHTDDDDVFAALARCTIGIPSTGTDETCVPGRGGHRDRHREDEVTALTRQVGVLVAELQQNTLVVRALLSRLFPTAEALAQTTGGK